MKDNKKKRKKEEKDKEKIVQSCALKPSLRVDSLSTGREVSEYNGSNM